MGKKRKSRKKMKDEKTLKFLDKCMNCEFYNKGLCKKYNDMMDYMMQSKDAPYCNGEPYKDKKGNVKYITI